ncbi:MAG: NIL domain-containing protein [Nitrospirae bacterium]|nr:NIL domain-containing protein [Nitrospirota bacterium]
MTVERHALRFHLTFPRTSVTEPVLCRIAREHEVEFNIRRADIQEGVGTMDLSLSGTHAEIDAAVKRMIALGVGVDPIERNVIE